MGALNRIKQHKSALLGLGNTCFLHPNLMESRNDSFIHSTILRYSKICLAKRSFNKALTEVKDCLSVASIAFGHRRVTNEFEIYYIYLRKLLPISLS